MSRDPSRHESRAPRGWEPGKAPKSEGWNQPMPADLVREDPSFWSEAPDPRQSEARLVERLQRRERDAVKELYRSYSPTLLKRLLRLFNGDMSQAEDCLQQVFLKALQSIDNYRGDNNLLAWLYRIATHAAMDVFRAQHSRGRFLERLGSFWSHTRSGVDGNQAIPEDMFLRDELRSTLHQGLQALHENKRMAILLCDLEGCSIEEASQQLEVPIGTLASRLYRGRQELRAWLQREFKRRGQSLEDWFDE